MALKLNGTNSVAAPAYAGADADTGLQCGTDEVNLVTGGTARLKIDSSGKVGIGSTSPEFKLMVADAGYSAVEIKSDRTSASDNIGGLHFKTVSTSVAYIQSLVDGTLKFRNTSSLTERMRIDSSGRVGIGTSSPSSLIHGSSSGNAALTLQTSGSSNSVSTNYQSTSRTYYTGVDIGGSNSAYTVYDGTASAERMRIDSSGNVGIGTSSPDSELSIGTGNTNNRIDLADERAYVGYDTSYGSTGALYLDGGGSSNKDIILQPVSTGKVGIGTTSPNGLLTVQANSGRLLTFRNSTTGTGSSDGSYIALNGSDLQISNAESANTIFYTGDTERMRINASGNVGIGTTSPSGLLHLSGQDTTLYISGAGGSLSAMTNNTSQSIAFQGGNTEIGLFKDSSGNYSYVLGTYQGSIDIPLVFRTGNRAERMRIDSSGALMVGTTTPGIVAGDDLTLSDSENAGITIRSGSSYSGSIYFSDGTSGADEYRGAVQYTHDGNYMRFLTDAAERMRVTNGGTLIIGGTDSALATIGSSFTAAGSADHTRSGGNIVYLNRLTNDGNLIQFYGDTNFEGSISISGSTISYNGGHLTRWSQLTGGAERTEILRGTVLSNLDEMCEWGEEDNEQLNRMKISDVEGDVNVAGVFQAWDDDDDTYTNDFYCAMTGDFVIRIAQGTTIARGDLLMSAGDGTAKPQDDDIVRSKTIAKVTSTTVSTTYSDGSYCVPCVLMAC